MIADLIYKVQNNDENATLELINSYNGLLKKYAYMLKYEDAYNDLVLDFVELLKKIKLENIKNHKDPYLISYICKSMRFTYINRSIRYNEDKKQLCFSSLNDETINYIENKLSITDNYLKLDFIGIEKILTDMELYIIHLIYYKNYSASEIANKLNVSRQAINQTKKRALKKLYVWLLDKHKEN